MREVIYKKNAGGYEFPTLNGELLSWSLDLYNSHSEALKNYPKMRTVIRALKEKRPEQLEKEKADLIKSSFDKMFGHNAEKILAVIKDELAK